MAICLSCNSWSTDYRLLQRQNDVLEHRIRELISIISTMSDQNKPKKKSKSKKKKELIKQPNDDI